MDLENIIIIMEVFLKLFFKIREILSMVKKMDMAFLLGLVDKNTK
jgi:hypothetical protein